MLVEEVVTLESRQRVELLTSDPEDDLELGWVQVFFPPRAIHAGRVRRSLQS